MNTSDYRVKDGVETVDGRAVPETRIVTLTPDAARYDLDTGKIEPVAVDTPSAKRERRAATEATDAPDGGN